MHYALPSSPQVPAAALALLEGTQSVGDMADAVADSAATRRSQLKKLEDLPRGPWQPERRRTAERHEAQMGKYATTLYRQLVDGSVTVSEASHASLQRLSRLGRQRSGHHRGSTSRRGSIGHRSIPGSGSGSSASRPV